MLSKYKLLFQREHSNKEKFCFISKTRMATFIKVKLKKSDNQMNIDKYREAANILENHIISKLIYLGITIPKIIVIR